MISICGECWRASFETRAGSPFTKAFLDSLALAMAWLVVSKPTFGQFAMQVSKTEVWIMSYKTVLFNSLMMVACFCRGMSNGSMGCGRKMKGTFQELPIGYGKSNV